MIATSRDERNNKIHLIADTHYLHNVIALNDGERHYSVPTQTMLTLMPPDMRVIDDTSYYSAELRR